MTTNDKNTASVEHASDRPPGSAATDRLLTTQEVASIVRMNAEYFAVRFRAGKLEGFPAAIRPGARLLWWEREVLAWIEGQRVPSGGNTAHG